MTGGLGALWAPQGVQWGGSGGKAFKKIKIFSLRLVWYNLLKK